MPARSTEPRLSPLDKGYVGRSKAGMKTRNAYGPTSGSRVASPRPRLFVLHSSPKRRELRANSRARARTCGMSQPRALAAQSRKPEVISQPSIPRSEWFKSPTPRKRSLGSQRWSPRLLLFRGSSPTQPVWAATNQRHARASLQAAVATARPTQRRATGRAVASPPRRRQQPAPDSRG